MKSYTTVQRMMAILGTMVVYFILGISCLKLATLNDNTSPFWLPSGFALGAVFYFGRWASVGVFLGAFLVNMTISQLSGSLLIATGNTLEAIFGCIILSYILRKNIFKQYTEFFCLLGASVFSPIISATVGSLTLSLTNVLNPADFSYSWFTWWSGDFIGMMVFTPLILYWTKRKNLDVRYLPYTGFFLVGLFTYTRYIFINDFNQAYAWTLCPLIILSGSLFGNFVSRVMLILLSLGIVYLTQIGHGPFEYGNLNLNFLFMQSLIGCCSISTLFVELFESETKLPRRFISGVMLGWCCVFFVIFTTSKIEKKHLIDDLKKTVAESIDSLEKTLAIYTNLSESGKAFLAVRPYATQQEWKRFAESLKIEKEFQAMNGFGFIKYYPKELAPKNLKYWDKEYSQQFPESYVITYLEPLEHNSKAIGFDIGSDPVRRGEATEARNLRKLTSSPPVTLVQDPLQRKSFVIINPVFNPLNNDFLGFVSSPVIASVFFESSLRTFSELLKINITHKGAPIHLIGKPRTNKHNNKALVINKSVMVFNQKYDFEFYPTSLFLKRHVGFTIVLALFLNLFMLFITGFLIEQLNFGQKAERLVLRRTKELEDSKIQLIHSSKMASLGEMAGGMAHEINNPLTIIQGKIKILSMLLEDGQPDRNKVQEEILKIKSTTERIGKIVRGLRTFSRASDNDPFESMPLNVVFKETLDLCSEKIKFFGINLEISPIPPVDIMCRPSQISQVVLNLFNNSLDAIANNNEKWIKVDFLQSEKNITILVTDSGSGIESKLANRIMEPFYTTKEPGKGTGLGLSISKGIIESHGGSFTYNASSPFTQFVIELPLT